MADFMTSNYANYYFEKDSIMMKFVHPIQHFPSPLCAESTMWTTKTLSSYAEQTKRQTYLDSPGSNRNDCATKIISKVQRAMFKSEYKYVCMCVQNYAVALIINIADH